jgi:hypothetical protein
MPYPIEMRNDEWCVIGPEGKVMGCHASRGQALAQQRALYAQEAKTASAVAEENGKHEPFKIQIGPDKDEAAAALVAAVDAITERLGATEQVMASVVEAMHKIVESASADREAFTAALTAAANQPEPVFNITVPDIILPEQASPTVNVHVPKSKILIPAQPTPVVNVTMPGSKKTVKFTRNLNGEVEQAEIVEDLE